MEAAGTPCATPSPHKRPGEQWSQEREPVDAEARPSPTKIAKVEAAPQPTIPGHTFATSDLAGLRLQSVAAGGIPSSAQPQRAEPTLDWLDVSQGTQHPTGACQDGLGGSSRSSSLQQQLAFMQQFPPQPYLHSGPSTAAPRAGIGGGDSRPWAAPLVSEVSEGASPLRVTVRPSVPRPPPESPQSPQSPHQAQQAQQKEQQAQQGPRGRHEELCLERIHAALSKRSSAATAATGGAGHKAGPVVPAASTHLGSSSTPAASPRAVGGTPRRRRAKLHAGAPGADAADTAAGAQSPRKPQQLRRHDDPTRTPLLSDSPLKVARATQQPGLSCASVIRCSVASQVLTDNWRSQLPGVLGLGKYALRIYRCAAAEPSTTLSNSKERRAAQELLALGGSLAYFGGLSEEELADDAMAGHVRQAIEDLLFQVRKPLATLAAASPTDCAWAAKAEQPRWEDFIIPLPGAAAAAAAAD